MSGSAGRSVVVHLRLLRGCGFCHVPRSRAHGVYRALTLAVTTTYLLQECIYAYQERSDMDKLARVMFLLLCHITSIAKQLTFYIDAERIDQLIDSLDDPLYNSEGAAARSLLAETARNASRFTHAYSSTAVVTCTLWIVFPIIYHLQGQPVEFPVWVYIDYSSSSKFFLVLLYSYYVTTLVGIANTTMDAFMATILNQCKTQLTILRINFETLPERALAISRSQHATENFERALDRLFLDCLTHYRKITEFVFQVFKDLTVV